MKVSESAVSCDTNIIQNSVHNQEIPCVFTDEELFKKNCACRKKAVLFRTRKHLKNFLTLLKVRTRSIRREQNLLGALQRKNF